jgi:hypothetical protein
MGRNGASSRARTSSSKKTVQAAEQERPDVAQAREQWRIEDEAGGAFGVSA